MSFCPIYYAYKVTNTINNKVYVGITSKLPLERWYHHVYEANILNTGIECGLKGAIRKYGKDAFKVEPLKIFGSVDDLKRYEMDIIKRFQLNRLRFPDGNGYNLTDGGDNYDCGKTSSYRDTTNAKKAQQKPVIATNTLTNDIIEYDSILEASKGTGVHRMTVFNLLQSGKRQRKGVWRFEYNDTCYVNSDGTVNRFGVEHRGKKSIKRPKYEYRVLLHDGREFTGSSLVELSKLTGISISTFHYFKKGNKSKKLLIQSLERKEVES